ncbi:MAG: molybdenum cofactor guanylyltransferase MobA [Pseudomonadota bacterium]
MKPPLGVILAGGKATRMGGGDKGFLKLGDQRLLDHVIARLGPQVSDIALNANGDPQRFDNLKLQVIADSIGGFAGPLSGVLAGLDWAADRGADRIVTVAADTPFFPRDLVARLILVGKEKNARITLAETASGRHPTFGLWPVTLREDLRSALADGLRKVVVWADQHGCASAHFPDDAAFFNINTPEDLGTAQGMI